MSTLLLYDHSSRWFNIADSLGLSAGAASATLHLVANGGDSEGLFHAIWAESGALQHIGHIDDPNAQIVFNDFVAATNCTGSNNTLQCLREVDGDALEELVSNSGTDFWLLTADGSFIQDLPQLELVHGHVAHNVSVVQGMQGTATLTICLSSSHYGRYRRR